nr:hypothetical protein [Tanacetum cinerariifolium]
MYRDKVKYDKYCLKMLNRRALGKITNCDVLSRGNGPITLKMQACPKRTRFGWTTIYTQMRQRLDALHKTEEELKLDFSKPLDKKDPILKQNLLAKKKRKNADDLHDYFRSTKRQDFLSIEYFEDLNNEMMYNVQEVFLRLHQGPGQDDLARTFSSLLVAEVEKRNLNPNKQMRLIEQLRH